MANLDYGYLEGPRQIVIFKVDSTSAAIVAGDTLTAATAGYVKQAAAGEALLGVAVDSVASPDADGDLSVKVDISEQSIYAYPPDAGSVSQGLVGTTMDTGGAQSINIDASTVDNVFCVGIDSARGLCHVKFTLAPAGVV